MRRRWWILGVAVVAALAVTGGAIWYFVFRDDAPPQVSLESASRSLTDGAGSRVGSAASVDGTWTVDASIGSFSDFTSSFAGFRVQEQLVSIGAKTAVGRTPDVTGTMTIEGTTVTSASFDVDMTTLTSDDGRRDNAIRSQAIETDRFPGASFQLTEPIELGSIPAEGEQIQVDATGELTLHGVTRTVTIPIEAQREEDVIAVVGSLDLAFEEYSISQPRAAAVLSVEDHGTFEVQLFMTKS